MLPGVNAATAARVKERITEGLRRAAGPNGRFTIEIDVTNYPEHAATAREMEDVLRAHVPSHGTPVRPAKPESVSASVQ